MAKPRRNETPAEPRSGFGCFVPFILLMLVVAGAYGAVMGAAIHVFNDAEGKIEALAEFRPNVGSKAVARDGTLLAEFAIEERQVVPLHHIPLHVQKAFIATEDHVFYDHLGVPFHAYPKILYRYLRGGELRGGSGITQQVVRNVDPLDIGFERSVRRKLREAIVALQVERRFTKDEILEIYLNQIFLGISAYGVEAAARQYFGKPAQALTLSEAALLAGLTRSPNANEPINNPRNALTRRDIVLNQMVERDFISQAEADRARAERVIEAVARRDARAAELAPARLRQNWRAPYYVAAVRSELLNRFTNTALVPPSAAGGSEADQRDALFTEGFEVVTALDPRLQAAAEDTLFAALDAFDARKRADLERAGRADEFVPVSGALVCIDNRPGQEGLVRALVGGRDFLRDEYSTATQARRQPGSSVKPFVWAAAIGSGLSPSTIVVDSPLQRVGGGGSIWAPQNFDGKFHGPVPIRYALEKSFNIVAIKLAERVGMPLVRSYMQSCGIRSPIDDVVGLTIALGTPEITVLEQAVAYSTFANLGVHYDPVLIAQINDRDGVPRFDYRTQRRHKQAIDPKVAYVVTHMLEGVCTPEAGYYPTGHRTSRLDRPRAGKTGTTNNSRNVWFCGYTPQFTAVVWVGYRDNRPLGHGTEYTGGRLACPIWTDFMIAAHEGLPAEEFEVPEGIEFHNIDRFTGVAGGNYREAYIAGTRPPQPAPSDPDRDAGLLLGEL